MKLKTPISFWRKGNSLTEHDGFLEDLHAGDVYYLKGRDSFNETLRAVSDAEIKDDEVFVPSETFNSWIESTRVNSSLQIENQPGQ